MKKQGITFIIIIIFVGVLFWQFDLVEILHRFVEIPLWIILFLLISQVFTQGLLAVNGQRFAYLLNIPITLKQMIYINCKSSVVGFFTPSAKVGGEVCRAYLLHRYTSRPLTQTSIMVATQKLMSLVVFAFFIIVSLPFILRDAQFIINNPFNFHLLSILFLVLVFVAILYAEKALKIVTSFARSVSLLFKQPRQLFILLAQTTIIWLLYPIKLYVLMLAFSSDFSFLQMTAIVLSAYAVAMLPIFPGGVGGFEPVMIGLLVTGGIDLADAVVVTLILRFTTFWLVAFVSFLYVTLLKKPFVI